MQLQLLAVHQQGHSLARRMRSQADAAQSVNAIAFARHETVGVPALRTCTAAIEAAIAEKRMARQRETGSARAKLVLEILTHFVCPVIGRRVRIAVLQNPYGSGGP